MYSYVVVIVVWAVVLASAALAMPTAEVMSAASAVTFPPVAAISYPREIPSRDPSQRRTAR